MGEVEAAATLPAVADARPPQRRLGGPANAVRYSAAVARRICQRLESGEAMRSICRDPEMPHRASVGHWMAKLPRFAEAVRRARRASGWHGLGGHPPKWCESLASEVCARVAEGERVRDICADPDMPSESLIFRWRATRPEFARAMAEARAMLAERFAEDGWEIAQAVTPQDAFATHVKLLQLRWTAGCYDPSRFGRHKPVERPAEERLAEAGGPTEMVFRVRRFERYVDEEGKARLREIFPDPE